VYDDGRKYVVPRAIHLVASRTAREYNQRKKRRGAFWEDHYHATAIESELHLHKCMSYIDLNMVRAGVVNHPQEWTFTGYNEILSERERYRLINKKKLQDLLYFQDEKKLKESYKKQIEISLNRGNLERESCWTESIAIGSKDFVEKIKSDLGIRAVHRKIIQRRTDHELREPGMSYTLNYKDKIRGLKVKILRN
jgi:putative transposase